jgi:hypothetical protein
MQRIGHSDPALTLRPYTHIVSEDDLKVCEAIRWNSAPKSKEEGLPLVGNPLCINELDGCGGQI